MHKGYEKMILRGVTNGPKHGELGSHTDGVTMLMKEARAEHKITKQKA